MRNIFKRLARLVKVAAYRRRAPLHLEFVVSDYCNLNCRGCTHYSALAPKQFQPIDQLRRTAARLGAVCGDGIEAAYLIGGETLLYPDLTEAMEILRHNFPFQQLYVYTNGIMLSGMSPEFWQTAHRLHFTIALTRYPINFDYDSAERLCRERGVEVKVIADRGEENSFFRFALDREGRQNAMVSHFKCYHFGCISVIGDRIYPCPISGCSGHLNRAFGTGFEHRPGDWLEVENVDDLRQIRRLRDKPVPFCRYCKLSPASVPYGPSACDPSEWVD